MAEPAAAWRRQAPPLASRGGGALQVGVVRPSPRRPHAGRGADGPGPPGSPGGGGRAAVVEGGATPMGIQGRAGGGVAGNGVAEGLLGRGAFGGGGGQAVAEGVAGGRVAQGADSFEAAANEGSARRGIFVGRWT